MGMSDYRLVPREVTEAELEISPMAIRYFNISLSLVTWEGSDVCMFLHCLYLAVSATYPRTYGGLMADGGLRIS